MLLGNGTSPSIQGCEAVVAKGGEIADQAAQQRPVAGKVVAGRDREGREAVSPPPSQRLGDQPDRRSRCGGMRDVVPDVRMVLVQSARRRLVGIALLRHGQGDDGRFGVAQPVQQGRGVFGTDEDVEQASHDAGLPAFRARLDRGVESALRGEAVALVGSLQARAHDAPVSRAGGKDVVGEESAMGPEESPEAEMHDAGPKPRPIIAERRRPLPQRAQGVGRQAWGALIHVRAGPLDVGDSQGDVERTLRGFCGSVSIRDRPRLAGRFGSRRFRFVLALYEGRPWPCPRPSSFMIGCPMSKRDEQDGPDVDRDAEWLEADGLGGYASGVVGGPPTRKYHGLLLVATTPPTSRVVLVNGCEAWLEGATGRTALSAQRYVPDVVSPSGFDRLSGFSQDPWPTWRWTLPDGTAIVHELLVAPSGCETVLRWRRLSGTGPCRLSLRLMLSARDQDALHVENPAFRFEADVQGGNVAWRPYASQPAIAALSTGTYAHDPVWYRNVLYTTERDRGYMDTEDLASPGTFLFDIAADGDAVMILRAGDGLAVEARDHAAMLAGAERARRSAAPSRLARSALSYRVARGTGKTIIAGFPWFSDWGRDTFISMRGLVLATGDLATAEAILSGWAGLVSQGMLPNRFPDRGTEPEYNAVDASLWYVVAVHDFLDAAAAAGRTLSDPLVARLRGACEAILEGYSAGTRFGIGVDGDGLVRAGVPGVQLTWMDAKTGDYVVTPRVGKPVEIQALWINALHIAATRWDAARWGALEEKPRATFSARFIRTDGDGLFDVVDVDHAPGAVDTKVRPNQVFAVGGLPFPILTGEAARAVVDVVEAKLLTPLGLRTLSPDDVAYQGRYAGGLVQRDGAYHQGTAWPWLLGPFVEAWLRVRGDTPSARAEAGTRFLPPLLAHLDRAGLGHVSEVVDGDAPHTPGGCPFQAWSLGELIRITAMLEADRPSSR